MVDAGLGGWWLVVVGGMLVVVMDVAGVGVTGVGNWISPLRR